MIDRLLLAALAALAACRMTTVEPVPFGVNVLVPTTTDLTVNTSKLALVIEAGGALSVYPGGPVLTDEELGGSLGKLVATAPSGGRIGIDLSFASPEVEATLPAADLAGLILRIRAALPRDVAAGAVVQIRSPVLGRP